MVSWCYSKKFTLCSLEYSCWHSQVYIVIKKLMIVREIFHYKQSICLENFQMEVKVGVCNFHNTYKIYEWSNKDWYVNWLNSRKLQLSLNVCELETCNSIADFQFAGLSKICSFSPCQKYASVSHWWGSKWLCTHSFLLEWTKSTRSSVNAKWYSRFHQKLGDHFLYFFFGWMRTLPCVLVSAYWCDF